MANSAGAEQVKAVISVLNTIVDAIAIADDEGIPSGHLYAMLMGKGMSYESYAVMIEVLVKAGKITQDKFYVLRVT